MNKIKKITVITSCTAQKTVKVPEPPDFETLQKIRKGEISPEQYSLHPVKAEQLYAGIQHRKVTSAVRNNSQRFVFDLNIISAGYGLIKGSDEIYPYEVTFSGKSKSVRNSMYRQLNLNETVPALLRNSGDSLVFILLGKDYLSSFSLPEDVAYLHRPYVLTAPSVKNIPSSYIHVGLGQPEAKRFGATLIALKGELFSLFIEKLKENEILPDSREEFLEFVDSDV